MGRQMSFGTEGIAHIGSLRTLGTDPSGPIPLCIKRGIPPSSFLFLLMNARLASRACSSAG